MTSGVGVEAHDRLGEPVQRVVLEALGERGVGIAAGEQLAEEVIGVGLVLHRAGGAGRDVW